MEIEDGKVPKRKFETRILVKLDLKESLVWFFILFLPFYFVTFDLGWYVFLYDSYKSKGRCEGI